VWWVLRTERGADLSCRPWTLDETKKHITTQLENSSVTSVTGENVDLPYKDHPVTLCCHSDSPSAVQIVKTARQIVDDFNKAHSY
jgi:lactam utilization protein B